MNIPEPEDSFPVVDLSEVFQLGLIVEWPSRVYYANQVGGLAVLQKKLQGIYIPLRDPILGPESHDELMAYVADRSKVPDLPDVYRNATLAREGHLPCLSYQKAFDIIFDKFGGNSFYGLDSETADQIDSLLRLRKFETGTYLSVDRARMKESMEAWVWIVGDGFPAEINDTAMSGFSKITGILTWHNSD